MLRPMDEQRLIDIETKLLQQELLTEELNQVVYKQQQIIDQLEIKLAGLVRRFREASEPGNDIGPSNEKPPHY